MAKKLPAKKKSQGADISDAHRAAHEALTARPMPPETLGQFEGSYPIEITAAHDMPLFVLNTLLNPDSPLHNPDHDHLRDHFENGSIQFLWAAPKYEKGGMNVLGQCELLQFRVGGWQKARHEQQFMEWFGFSLPDWIITLSAGYCYTCTAKEYMALVDHELYHIAQESVLGTPKFSKTTGLPILKLRGHDVEEFNGIVRRYGLCRDTAAMFQFSILLPEMDSVLEASRVTEG